MGGSSGGAGQRVSAIEGWWAGGTCTDWAWWPSPPPAHLWTRDPDLDSSVFQPTSALAWVGAAVAQGPLQAAPRFRTCFFLHL